MYYLYNLIVLLFSLIGLMVLLKKRLQISYVEAPLLTFTFLMAVLYLASFLGFLFEFALILFLLGLMYGILHIYQTLKGSGLKTSILLLKNAPLPLVCFGVLFLLNWIVFRNHIMVGWDEFSFWGYFTKILTQEHDLIAQYNDINKVDYPRITSLIQYYFNLYLNGGKFSEGVTIFGQTMILASTVPFFLPSKPKKNRVWMILFPIGVFLMFFVFVQPVYLVYNDNVLGLFWAISIIIYLQNKNKEKGLYLAMALLFCLPLIKEIGLVFALFSWFVIGADYFFFRTKQKNERISALKRLGLALILILVAKLSWSGWLYYSNVNNNSFQLELSQIDLGNLKKFQKTTLRNYLDTTTYLGDLERISEELKTNSENVFIAKTANPINFNNKIEGINKIFNASLYKPGPDGLYDLNVSLSLIYWIVLFLVYGVLIYALNREVVAERIFTNKWHYAWFMSFLLLVLLGYAILLLILYLYSFGEYESIRLVSYGRYIGTMLFGLYLVIFYFMTKSRKRIYLAGSFVLVMMLFTPVTAMESFAPRHTILRVHNITIKNDLINPMVETLKKEDANAQVMLLDQTSVGGLYVQFKYLAFPLNVTGNWSYHPKEKITNKTKITSVKEFEKILKDYDYIVIWNDKHFWESYGEVVKRSSIKGIWKLENKRRFVKISPLE